MNVRTYLDKNFFHNLREADQDVQQKVIEQFARRRYSCYLAAELLEEMIAIWGVPSRIERLAIEARLVLNVMHERLFKYYGDLVIGELRDGSAKPFVACSVVEKAKSALRVMAGGGMPEGFDKLPRLTRERKQADRDAMIEHRGTFLDDLKKLEKATRLQHPPFPTYEECRERYWARWVEDTLKSICERGNVIGADTRIEEIVVGTGKYPFTNAAMRTHLAVIHQNLFTDRPADDMYDAQQVVCMTQLDLLVTNDRGMKKLCGLVHGARVGVMTFQEFTSQL
ncbi:MAG: hypothetical protein HY600_01065 [Candidatus Omnitrophica bacterium]|nr:hypothetical protein [Candidatus Omnitrophota bacterium]